MKHLDLIIPTRNRLDKLERMLDSIEFSRIQFDFSVIIVTDNDPISAEKMRQDSRVSKVIEVDSKNGTPIGSVYCRNQGTMLAEDGVSWGVDDVVYDGQDFFNIAFEKYNSIFSNDEGVLAFNVLNNKHRVRKPGQSRCGMGMVGQQWLSQYPKKQLFYPGYFHFSCQEIVRLGKKFSKLEFAEELKVYHLSPCAGEVVDTTHVDARKYRMKDMKVSGDRKNAGLIWGAE